MADILVVDDDQSVATAFERFLDAEGHECRLASGAAEAMRMIEQQPPNVVIMDIRMPGVDGLQALQQFRSRFPGIYVVMMTAYGTSQTSIDAIRSGAFDYLTKPLDLDQLREVIGKALTAQQVVERPAVSDGSEGTSAPVVSLVGETPVMLEVYKMIGRLSTNSAPALVTGERGTGKHLVVATIHENSERGERALLTVNCANVSQAEVDIALSADGAGTVELDDVHLLPLPLQTIVAQTLAAARTKGAVPRLTARIIATSDRDLADETRAGRFAQALYDELAVVTVRLRPLRERRDDIPLLVRQFIQRFNVELNRDIRGVEDQVERALQQHSWPGNVRELENVIERAMIRSTGETLLLDDTFGPARRHRVEGAGAVGDTLDAIQRAHIEAVLSECGWRINGRSNAAERLGLHPNTLRFRMKKLGIVCPDRQLRQAPSA
jgi:DNA-binding NtrC family response regulator